MIVPSKNYIMLKPIGKEKITSTGFLLTEDSAEAPQMADVVSVGEDAPYKIGDRVIYRAYATTDFKFDNQQYYLIHIEDVLGKIK